MDASTLQAQQTGDQALNHKKKKKVSRVPHRSLRWRPRHALPATPDATSDSGFAANGRRARVLGAPVVVP